MFKKEGLLTIAEVAQHPQLLTYPLSVSDEHLVFRPLVPNDRQSLTEFLENLSPKTRRFSTFTSYDARMAQELCDAINRYDKLRFVVETTQGKIVALLEFSFGLPKDDIERYKKYEVTLSEEYDCRFGPTIADTHQDKGLGSEIMPYIKEIAKRFGKNRMILYGGVFAENKRALHFYIKHGFQKVGEFQNPEGKLTVDMTIHLHEKK